MFIFTWPLFLCCFIKELPPPSLGDVGARSVILNWDEPPPELTGDLPRAITQYAVTLTPRDGGSPISTFAPAEAGTSLRVTGLKPETEYDVEVMAVIDTEGQGEETYDLGIPILTIETSKTLKFKIFSIFTLDVLLLITPAEVNFIFHETFTVPCRESVILLQRVSKKKKKKKWCMWKCTILINNCSVFSTAFYMIFMIT